jgi:hypothetical protein
MKRWVRTLLPLLVPALSVIYGVGEFFQWWDVLSGRQNARAAYERFASNKNYPTIIINDDEPEFERLYQFIIKRTAAEEVKKFNSEKAFPYAIVRFGGTMGHEIEKDLPKGWPSPRFVPETSPIAFLYEKISRDEKVPVFRVSSLGEIKRWTEESKETERFWVATVLIGLLSVVVVVLEQSRSRD